MRFCLLALFAISLLPAQVPDRRRMDAPALGSVTAEVRRGERITLVSPWWRVSFDLRHGGVLDTLIFPHGSNRNVLVEPFRTYVGGWSDAGAPRVKARTWEEMGTRMVEFTGALSDSGGKRGPVEFRTLWTATPFALRAEHTLRFMSDQAVDRVGIGSTRIRPQLNECGVRPGPDHDTNRTKGGSAIWSKISAGKPAISEQHAPIMLFFYERGVEGFDLTTATSLSNWESALTGHHGVGRFEASAEPGGASVRILREPLSVAQPVRVAKGEYTFGYYLGLPQVVERSNRSWRHIVIGNHPWPADSQIREWAAAGANIARIHNDFAPDGNFWRDGAWPPYDAAGMAEMKRVIAACHRYGIQVVPYFSLKEFHPEAQGYAENETAWKRTIGPLTSIHDKTQNGEYGAQMCMQSGWLERRKQDVEKAYRELGFDGIYYDWVATQACDNPAHNLGTHLDTDAVIDMLAWTRRLLAPTGGPLVLHLSGWFESIAMENYADLVVNMEEFSSSKAMMTLDSVPISGFQAEVLPRSPCPSYREDNAQERSRNNAALQVVLGLFQHARPDSPAGVEMLRLFRAFKPYNLNDFRFRSVYTKAVTSPAANVLGALYTSPSMSLAVVSNASPNTHGAVTWRVNRAELGFNAARITVKDTTTGETRTVDAGVLDDGSLSVSLAPYEYRLFEIRPAR